ALKAESAIFDGQTVSYTHEGDVLAVEAPTGAATGNVHTLVIRYSGAADRHGLRFSTDKGGRYIANFGMPYTAKQWWPDFDSPAFKARSADIRITLPSDMT